MEKCKSYGHTIRPQHRPILRISRRFHLTWLLLITMLALSACGKMHYVSRGETQTQFATTIAVHNKTTLGHKGAKQYGALHIQPSERTKAGLLMLKRLSGRYAAEGLLFSRKENERKKFLEAGFLGLCVDNKPQMVGLQLRLVR